MHEDSCFLTLTYDDEHLPPGGSLRPRDWTLFMKRLRSARPGQRIRFLQCGEYGDTTWRPHHHALLYGTSFPDRKLCKRGDFPLYSSAELDSLWRQGGCTIGALSHESAAYCARYTVKKITGDLAESHYRFIDPSTGEVFQRHPEYATMSTKPGLGAGFIERFLSDIYPGDFCATKDGGQVPVPPYYDKLLQRENPELFERIKAQRLNFAMQPKRQADSTPARLAVREVVKRAAISQLRRSL